MKKFLVLALAVLGFYGLQAAPGKTTPTGQPAPGKWDIVPHVLVEGTETPLEIRYEHTGADLQPGEGFHLYLEKLSISSLFHCPMSETIEIIPWKGDLPKYKLTLGDVNGVGYREMNIIFPDGLKKGQTFAISFGNKQPDGSVKALINPFPMTNLGLPTYSRDAKGKLTDWVDAGWFNNVPHCDIVPGPASDMRVFLPSIVQVGKPFPLRISVTDGLDSRATPYFEGKLTLKAENPGISGLPASVTLVKGDSSYKEVPNLTINKEGVYRIAVTMPDGKTKESNPVVVRKQVDKQIYWGNIHNHGQYSECFGMSNAWFYISGHKVNGMDYAALSDHIATMPRAAGESGRLYKWRNGHPITAIDAWRNTIETSDKFNDPKNGFVAITGYEAGGIDNGHWNVYMDGATMNNMDKMFAVSRSTPYVREVRDVVEKAPTLYIHHLHAAPTDLTMLEEFTLDSNGKPLSPCVEIYSDWGSSFLPYDKTRVDSRFGGVRAPIYPSILWALGHGMKFGCIGDSDSHTGLPGRRVIGSPAAVHDHPVGLTAVMTGDFSRQGLINGYKDKSVYATTGEHMFLDFQINGVGMGQDLATDDKLNVFVQIAGTDKLTKFNLWNGLTKVYSADLNTRDTILRFTLPAPDYAAQKAYVVEVYQQISAASDAAQLAQFNTEGGNMAWSSPIWVSKAGVPDLAWEQRKDGLYLVNNGKAAATNVEVGYSPTEQPFTTPSIMGLPDMKTPESAYLWTERRDDHTVFVHLRWQGDQPMKATMLTPGITCDPKNDVNHNSGWGRSTAITTGTGDHELTYDLNFVPRPFAGKENHDYFPGISWIMKTDNDKPAYIELQFDRPVTTWMDGQGVKTNDLRVPLNGLTGGNGLKITTVAKLAPGASYKVAGTKGLWSADPHNKIAESNEGNNLFQVK